jgi:hypothetical protein
MQAQEGPVRVGDVEAADVTFLVYHADHQFGAVRERYVAAQAVLRRGSIVQGAFVVVY